jgi:hypothetical protein
MIIFKILRIIAFNYSKIIIYGGLYYNDDTPYGIPSKETIAILDTITLVWSIPPLEDINDIPKLAFHSANMFSETKMLVAFGELLYFFLKKSISF